MNVNDNQPDRLGPMARAIVDKDVEIAACRDGLVESGVIRFAHVDDLKAYREMIRDRLTLTRRADEIWGSPLRRDGGPVVA